MNTLFANVEIYKERNFMGIPKNSIRTYEKLTLL